jgi:23S rRNA pseudouridine1911/1915/1917 synthase
MTPGAARSVHLVAAPADAGLRLDRFLASHLTDLSRAQIQRLIREGHVTVSRGEARPSRAVEKSLVVDVVIPAPVPAEPLPEALPITILFEDGDIVVIDKPAGMVVHPGAGHAGGTLVNALLHHVRGLKGVGGTERPGLVHRLDRGTSGVMVIAKHDRAHRELTRQFHDREVEKEYVALVWGTPRRGQVFERPIGRDPKHRQRMSSRSRRGRTAVTRLLEVDALGGVSLVRVSIATGRTHQIRVHLSEAGHPVVGDALYGGGRRRSGRLARIAVERPLLHAAQLALRHPGTGERLVFRAPIPADLADAVARLRTPH